MSCSSRFCIKRGRCKSSGHKYARIDYFKDSSTATATETVIPTMGSDGSAACGGVSDLSEWQRSARDEAALSARTFAGHRNRGSNVKHCDSDPQAVKGSLPQYNHMVVKKRASAKADALKIISYFRDSSTATATETVIPTMGLLPAPRKPIISTCAGTEEEPANWASPCIRPMVSVMP